MRARLCYYKDDISSNLTGWSAKYKSTLLWTAWHAFFKKMRFQELPVFIRLSCLSVHRHNVSPRCLSQLSLPTSKLVFYNMCKFYVTWKYMETIYCSNIKTLCFLEELCSVSVMLFTPQLGNQAIDHFHFYCRMIYRFPVLSWFS